MKDKKISILLSSLEFGGAERVMLNLAEAITEKGVTVELVLTRKEGGFLEEAEKRFRVVDLHMKKTYTLPFKLLRYIIASRPNAVISNNWKQSLCACLTRLLFPFFKILVVEHGTPDSSPESKWIFSIIATVFYRAANKVITVSIGVADDIKQCTYGLSDKLEVIYNAIYPPGCAPIKKEKQLNESCLTVITVGTLCARKNHALLLEAFAIVVGRVNAKLVMVSDGELRKKLESQAKHLGIADRVSFVGYHSNPCELMVESDLFVLASNYEGLPTVLIEALYCGLPIVSTDCPHGPREILMNGEYGTLVKVGDAIALADAIVKELSKGRNPVRQQRGAERFLPDRIACQYLSALGFTQRCTARR